METQNKDHRVFAQVKSEGLTSPTTLGLGHFKGDATGFLSCTGSTEVSSQKNDSQTGWHGYGSPGTYARKLREN